MKFAWIENWSSEDSDEGPVPVVLLRPTREDLADAIAAYARHCAGGPDDLDEPLEAAGIELLVTQADAL
jgi:hypothetical protein